jgi:NAD+ diphosphatase
MNVFTAGYESGEIKVDEKEIKEAFGVDEVPRMPSKMSIASELIE